MATWSVIAPQAATNFVMNPSAEAAGNFAALASGTVTRVTTQHYKGAYSFRIQGTADGDGATLTLGVLANAAHILSFYIRGTPGATGVKFSVDGGSNYNNYVFSAELTAWTGGTVSLPAAQCSGSVTLRIAQRSTGAMDIYIDALQIELGSTLTTYMDADQPGCTAAGTPHQSLTSRPASSREGGISTDMATYITLRDKLGVGVPPIKNVATAMGLAGGAVYQRSVRQARAFTLLGTIEGSSVDDLHLHQRQLFDLLKPDLVATPQPLSLIYYPGVTGDTLRIRAVYEGGLEFESQAVNVMAQVPLRFVAHDPLWYEEQDAAAALGVTQDVTDADYILQRSASGLWSALGTGLNGSVTALSIGPDGHVYVGGTFSSAGGVTVGRLARWNGTAFAALDSDFDFTEINAIAIAPDGTIYIGGLFGTVNSVAFDNIAQWNGTTWSALGATPGTNGAVHALAIDPATGYLYVGGVFTTAGGVTVNRIALWNGTDWSALSGTPGTSGGVYALAFDSSNKLVLGGTFATAGGVTVNGAAVWNGAAFTAMAGGISSGIVYALARGPDGLMYAGGSFTVIGGITTNYVARWNGAAWTALGTGLNNTARVITFDDLGRMYCGGGFTTAGGLTVKNMAMWNGSTWVSNDATLPSGPATVRGLGVTPSGVLFVGFDSTGTGTTAAITSVTNNGSAEAHPRVTFTGPGTVAELVNWTTGDALWLNLTLLAGEIATLDLTPGAIAFTSSFRGNILGTILPGSNLTTWRLLPGVNSVGCFITGSTAATEAALVWRNAHWSIDGVQ